MAQIFYLTIYHLTITKKNQISLFVLQLFAYIELRLFSD